MTTEQTTTPAPSLSHINPMANTNGDTSKVSAALEFVTWALRNGNNEEGEIALTTGQAFGLAVILDTCNSALKEML